MSGELGLAGYVFQYHVIVLTALEVWSGETDSGAASILVEGLAGADKVDYALVSALMKFRRSEGFSLT